MPVSGTQITQLGPSGHAMRRYGSFAGKAVVVPTAGFMPDAAFVAVTTPSGGVISEVTLPNRGTILDE